MNHKDIGDKLTDSELNDIMYRLRNITQPTLEYNISNTVETPYGTLIYTYGTEYYKRKNGILSNDLKVKLTNPTYTDATYTIRLTFEDRSSTPLDTDTPTITTNDYTLVPNEFVTITEADLDTLTRYASTLYINYTNNRIQTLGNITLTNSKTHVVEDETCTITGKVYTNNGNLIDGEDIEVYLDEELDTTLTMTDKKVTYTYTGQGDTAHKLTFKAKNDETVSTDYMVKDCYYDDGDWYNHNSNVTIADDGTLSYNGTGWGGYFADTTGTASSLANCLQHEAPFAFEFDVHNPYGNCYVQVSDGTNAGTVQRKFIVLSQTKKDYHVRVEVLEDSIKYYVDDRNKSALTWTGEMSECRVGFRLNNGSSLKFDNFYMYNLGDAEPVTPVDTVSLSADPTTVTIGSSSTLTATVTLEDTTPGDGKTVTFYDGSTSLGTATTNSSGVATFTYSPLTSGSHSVKAVCGGVESSSVSITVNKVTSTISLSGSGVTYPNSVSLSGTLSAGSGKSVKIYQGSTLLDTVSTGTGGAFTKTVSGLNAGSYTFKAVFSGDTTYSEVTSSDLSVTVAKASPTISLATSSASVSVGQSFTLSGTLSVGTGQSVKIYAGQTLVDTVSTGTGGAFSKSITPVSAGTYSYTAVFEATSNYNSVTSSSVSVSVDSSPTPVPASVSLTADKSVLSFYDSESATLSATVLDGSSNPVENETVEFFKGSTSLGTASTNSSGVATKSYASTGAGDLSFTASVGSLVSETFVLEDCLFYGINVNAFTVPSDTTFTSDGTKITATTSTSGEKLVYFDHTFSNNDNWLFETELAEVTTPQSMAIIFNDNSYYGGQYPTQTNKAFTNMGSNVITSHTFATGDKYKVVRENGVTTVYINDTSIQSKTTSHKTSFKVGYYITQNRTQYYKNIKVKLL